jgi:phage terminase large subunit-like protein
MQTVLDQSGRHVVKPQDGRQMQFCSCTADIAIYGGAAYGGKTVSLLLESTRNVSDRLYRGVIFRRKHIEIVAGGGLWDTSQQIYPGTGGHGTRGLTLWSWNSGSEIKFSHLNQEKTVEEYQGAAFIFIGFDELTHFTKYQFIYMLTRNRPPAGCRLRPYMRATCNPDADSWVSELIKWWIDQNTGFAIPERAGVVRYFTVSDNEIIWVPKDWRSREGIPPKSITFIPSSIEDNPLGNIADPTYRANLLAQDRVTRERLLRGNWLISFSGEMFDPTWFEIVDNYPSDMRLIRYWDLAESELDENKKNDPDFTAGALVGIKDDVLYIIDVVSFRETPAKAEQKMLDCAIEDGPAVEISWEEVKANGKWVSTYLKKLFTGYETHPDPVEGSKTERARPWSAMAEKGRVKLVRGKWNQTFKARAGKFPDGKRDEIDAVSGAVKVLVGNKKVIPYYFPSAEFHLQVFRKDLEAFQKVEPNNVEIYVSMWYEGGMIYGFCAVWAVMVGKLRIYNEFVIDVADTKGVMPVIMEKLVVQIDCKTGWVSLHKCIGNEEFFKKGLESLSKEFRNAGLKVRQNTVYDELAAVSKINNFFSQNKIIVHGDCVEMDTQIRGWTYEKNGKPKAGYPFARALCLLMSDLRSRDITERGFSIPEYSKAKMNIRENLRTNRARAVLNATNTDKMYEYLTR